jgi:hypothetical protein
MRRVEFVDRGDVGVLALLIALLIAVPAAAQDAPPRVLVTGDSMVQPLDKQVVRHFKNGSAKVITDPRPGTGISRPLLLDWTRHALQQTRKHRPDAVAVLIGAATDAEPLTVLGGRQVECCRQVWIDTYQKRVEAMMRNYLSRKGTRVYWFTLPAPRKKEWQMRFNAVNLAFQNAAVAVGDRVTLVDLIPALTPGNVYRHRVKGRVVRDKDGIHLNAAGSKIARKLLLKAMRADGLID